MADPTFYARPHVLFRVLAAAALVVACSSESTSEPSTDPAAPAVTPPAAPAPTDAPPPATTAPAPPPGPALTTVRVHYAGKPGALSIRGGKAPLSWDVSLPLALAPGGSAVYTWSSAAIQEDLELKPMLGDAWSRGPNYRVKPGKTIDIYPHFVETQGAYSKRYPAFVSQKLPSTRGVWVYLPPTYLENTEARFGVVYMQDGQNLFDAATAFGGNEWKVDETLDAAAEDGSIREVVVVGIENTGGRIDELTPTVDATYGGGKADQYLSMIVDELKPKIDAELRTIPTREQTAVMGSSLGGLFSAYVGVHRSDVFGLVGAMSPSTWWDNTFILGDVATMAGKPNRPLRVYVDSGDAGASNDDVANTTLLAGKYRSVGYTDGKDFKHVVQAGGQHNEIYWSQRLPAALSFVVGPRDAL
jgi:predicted alpha/beta superfamily hydrolase